MKVEMVIEGAVIDNTFTVERIQRLSWICLAILGIAALLVWSWEGALSVLAGGTIATGSFSLATRDIRNLSRSITNEPDPEGRQAIAREGQRGYLVKFFLRIVLIGVVLLLLIKFVGVNIFGLVLGLSTVVLAIALTGLDMVRYHFFRGRR